MWTTNTSWPIDARQLQAVLEAVRIEEIGDDDREPALARPRRELREGAAEIRVAGRLHLLEQVEDAKDPALAAARHRFVVQAGAERQNRHAIQVREADVAEPGDDASRLVEFRRLDHRPAGVEKQVDRQVLLFVEQPEQQPVQALVGLPVDVAEVVAGRILAVIGELQPAPALARQPVGAILPGERALRDDVQVLELFEEVVFKSAAALVQQTPSGPRVLASRF